MAQLQRRRRMPGTSVPTERTAEADATIDDADALLDEIDAALEENELEVVRTFRQKGGQ